MMPVLISLGSWKIYSFGVFLLLGVLMGVFISWKKAREYHFEEDGFFDSVMLSILGAVVGGRLFYIIEHLEMFADKWLRAILIYSYPGMSWWGAVLLGGVVLWWRVRRNKLHLWLDTASLGMSLGLVWGRIGSLLNGSMLGISTDTFLGVQIIGTTEKVLPTQAFESLGFILITWLLWKWEGEYRNFYWYRGSKSSAKAGFLFYIFLAMMGMVLGVGSMFYQWGDGWAEVVYKSFSVISILLGIVGVYGRSGRSLRQDLRLKRLAS